MPWKPDAPGEVPTLGFAVLDWIIENLAAPDRVDYEPFIPTQEQAQFILNWYQVDIHRERRKYRRGVLSRSRGWGKSPLLGALAAVEALGPVVFDGWDANGQPVGKPWSEVRTPLVQLAAVAESQTKNSYTPLREMLINGPVLDNYPGLEPMDTFINLPNGRIEPITSSAHTVKGNRAVFCVIDQSEEWVPSNGGPRLAETIRINAAKIGGSTIESPNAFTPGTDSVAEKTAEFYNQIIEGRAKDVGLLYDHREAPPETDMTDRESLLAGLLHVYGDSAEANGGWVDLERIVGEIWDPGTDPQTARADFLNQITHASDAWLSQPEWAGCADPLKVVADRDTITLGFDGSRHRKNGVTDATALVACRVSDGHMFLAGLWEQPDNTRDWWVPTYEVTQTVKEMFDQYSVVGFYADPAADWRSFVADWEARYTDRLLVKSTTNHPIEWWMGAMNLTKTVRALDQFHSAVIHKEMSHDGGSALTRHMLNARRRTSRAGWTIAKDFPESPRKIDAAVAGALAWQARLDALASGSVRTDLQKSRKLVRF